MADDIVTRLRKVPEKIIRMSGSEMNPYYNRCQDAADEIERLRSERDVWYHLARRLYDLFGEKGAEVLMKANVLYEYEKAVRGE